MTGTLLALRERHPVFYPPEMVDATDLFCGGGGSSEGMRQAGIYTKWAANHWRHAVNTHQANHPDAAHDCADISQVDPRRYGRTTVAWISPDCTNHVKANGKKRDQDAHTSDGKTLPDEPAERSRATMWDVVRFSEYHDYDVVMVENVVEVLQWRPYQAWLMAMHANEYEHQTVFLSSAHVSAGGTAANTNRNRYYTLFHKKGATAPDLARWTNPYGQCDCGFWGQLQRRWKRADGAVVGGVYGAQYMWACAACGRDTDPQVMTAGSIIDWSNPGLPLMARKRADRSVEKVQMGLTRHAVNGMAMPFIVELRGGGSTTRGIDVPLSTITAKGNHHALVIPPGYDPVTGCGSVPAIRVRPRDCTYRLVSVEERKLASGFGSDYILPGTDAQQIRMIGNAVTPNVARAIGAAVTEALTGVTAFTSELELAA